VELSVGILKIVKIKNMNRYQKLFNELKQENAVNTEVNDHLMVFDGL